VHKEKGNGCNCSHQKEIKQKTPGKSKSVFRIFNIFGWGCKGNSKGVSKPSKNKPRPQISEYKPGRKLGHRDVKSERDAKSINDDLSLFGKLPSKQAKDSSIEYDRYEDADDS
jgi:hypothetical protein